jgi:dipeptidyl aminopeptidase/acylaminoacyl peptidase
MLFHVRDKHAGTVFWKNSRLLKVDTKTDSTISAGVYPSWHPEDRFVAFSTNNIVQSFHAIPDKKVEVLDTLSDLIIYDTEENVVSSNPDISSPGHFETFPEWSPDGRSLFFCRAKALPPEQYDEIRYDLFKIGFSHESKTFGKLTPVLNLSNNNQSITFPRISPDGKYLLFCVVDYGNFSIWHKESDLFYLNIDTGEVKEAMQLNSNQSESYHSWSQNGKWVVFSSRRQNGLYTQPFISYFDANGNFSKPFILPQKSPDFYNTFLKSYNIPEFVTSKVKLRNMDLINFINSNEKINSKL